MKNLLTIIIGAILVLGIVSVGFCEPTKAQTIEYLNKFFKQVSFKNVNDSTELTLEVYEFSGCNVDFIVEYSYTNQTIRQIKARIDLSKYYSTIKASECHWPGNTHWKIDLDGPQWKVYSHIIYNKKTHKENVQRNEWYQGNPCFRIKEDPEKFIKALKHLIKLCGGVEKPEVKKDLF